MPDLWHQRGGEMQNRKSKKLSPPKPGKGECLVVVEGQDNKIDYYLVPTERKWGNLRLTLMIERPMKERPYIRARVETPNGIISFEEMDKRFGTKADSYYAHSHRSRRNLELARMKAEREERENEKLKRSFELILNAIREFPEAELAMEFGIGNPFQEKIEGSNRKMKRDLKRLVRSIQSSNKMLGVLPFTIDDEEGIVVTRPPLKDEFNLLKSKLGNVRRLYHGTSTNNIGVILREGLKLGQESCSFGSGIYLGLPAKASCFSRPSTHCKVLSQYSAFGATNVTMRSSMKRYLIECEVVLGSVYTPEHVVGVLARGSMERAGCNSVYYNRFKQPEWVVYNPKQVLIKRIVEV